MYELFSGVGCCFVGRLQVAPAGHLRPEIQQLRGFSAGSSRCPDRSAPPAGVPATAQVMDMVEEREPVVGYVQVRFWVMLRVNGNITYRHIQTLLNKDKLPSVGDVIHIRFCPDDMSKVIVL